MTAVTNQGRLQIAEKSAGSLYFLALLFFWATEALLVWWAYQQLYGSQTNFLASAMLVVFCNYQI